MKILLQPQISPRGDEVRYKLTDNIIKVHATVEEGTYEDTFDFTEFPDGKLILELEDDKGGVKTSLPFNPILNAERVNGELRVVLIHYISIDDAEEKDLFTDWIDHDQYNSYIEKLKKQEER